jgi:peroxiredoxin
MSESDRRSPIQPGEPAPEFDLPAASGSGPVSLSHYRGQSPLYLALFRGLY